jgi:competence protein ComEC
VKPKLSFHLSKPLLIEGRKEWIYLIVSAVVILIFSLSYRYYEYTKFTSQKKIYLNADVLLHYSKHKGSKHYDVLKLQTQDGMVFYTTAKNRDDNLRGRMVRLVLFPSRLKFKDFLTTPYIPSYILRVLESKTLRMKLFEEIKKEHTDPWIDEFYGALFLALPISKSFRKVVTRLGINHLLALSGFHMGFLWLIIYFSLSVIYKPFQQRFFPYRHRLLDIGLITILILGSYLLFVGMPPSLLRAYVMVVVGWLALLAGIELLSFTFLAVCVIWLIALFPGLLFSIGFWLSVSGVFYIYLFLHYTKSWSKWAIFIVLNFWTYLMMLPIVHTFFGLFSLYQLSSIVLTLIFSIFYPLAIIMHILGIGGLFDGLILNLFSLPNPQSEVYVLTPLWFLAGFIVLSLFAVRWRKVLYIQIIVALGWFVFLIYL